MQVRPMSRFPHLVIPGYPHHVTQRGNPRPQMFFEDGDYALYESMLAEAARKAGSEIWAYCLMPTMFISSLFLRMKMDCVEPLPMRIVATLAISMRVCELSVIYGKGDLDRW